MISKLRQMPHCIKLKLRLALLITLKLRIMKKLLLILITVSSGTLFAQPNWEWAKSSTAQGNDKIGTDLSADAVSNIYSTGTFNDSLVFGATTLLATQGTFKGEIFIVKHDSSGNFVWAIQSDGGSQPTAEAIYTDASGNSYVTGGFQGSIDFGAITLNSTNTFGKSMYILKVDANGTPVWANFYAAPGLSQDHCIGNGITLDNGGTIYVGGNYRGTIDLGNSITMTNAQATVTAPFVAAFNASGVTQWADGASGGSFSDVRVNDIAINSAGTEVYTIGTFKGSIYFNDTITSTSNRDIFFTKHSNAGTYIWSKTPVVTGSSSAVNRGTGVSTDNQNNVYFTGFFGSDITFGATTTLSAGTFDDCSFVTKYDATGTAVWASQIGSSTSADNYATGIYAANDGTTFVTGSMSAGSLNFGTNTLVAQNGDVADLFVVSYDPNGNEDWGVKALDTVVSATGSLGDGANDIIVSGTGVYVTGFFQSIAVAFGGSIINTQDGKAFFLAKLGSAAPLGLADNKLKNDKIKTYPNPFNTALTISNKEGLNIKIEVLDLTGKIVLNTKTTQTRIILKTGHLTKGMYLLKITDSETGELLSTKKVINQ
jgi:Secretion system C-terminal sorting domain